MSESLILGIATLGVGFCTTVFTGVMAYLVLKLNKKQDKAAVEVKEVKEQAEIAAVKVDEVAKTLETTAAAQDKKLDGIALNGEKIHTLVNSAMSAQLKISAVALRRVSDMTKHPDDEAAASLAERSLHEHEVKQAMVDRKEKSPEVTP